MKRNTDTATAMKKWAEDWNQQFDILPRLDKLERQARRRLRGYKTKVVVGFNRGAGTWRYQTRGADLPPHQLPEGAPPTARTARALLLAIRALRDRLDAGDVQAVAFWSMRVAMLAAALRWYVRDVAPAAGDIEPVERHILVMLRDAAGCILNKTVRAGLAGTKGDDGQPMFPHSKRTVEMKLARLRQVGFVHRPYGDRSGSTITDAGREYLNTTR